MPIVDDKENLTIQEKGKTTVKEKTTSIDKVTPTVVTEQTKKAGKAEAEGVEDAGEGAPTKATAEILQMS